MTKRREHAGATVAVAPPGQRDGEPRGTGLDEPAGPFQNTKLTPLDIDLDQSGGPRPTEFVEGQAGNFDRLVGVRPLTHRKQPTGDLGARGEERGGRALVEVFLISGRREDARDVARTIGRPLGDVLLEDRDRSGSASMLMIRPPFMCWRAW